jgi:hypothetical protein
MQGSRGARAGVPPFMFRVFRYFILSLSLMYNLGRVAYGGYMGDLMVIFSTARFIATALQFADHYWLCSNWSSFFESGKIRRYIWARLLLINPILSFLNIFANYLDETLNSYSFMIITLYNVFAILIFLFWLYWGEYIAGGLYSSRYFASRNAFICLVLDQAFYIAADVYSPYLLLNFGALTLYIGFAAIFHWLIVREQRATKVLADDPDTDNKLNLAELGDSFELPVCVDVSTSENVKYRVECKTPPIGATTEDGSLAGDKVIALASQVLYWDIFVYTVELCVSGYFYNNYHTPIEWCPTFSFATTVIETTQSLFDMFCR